MLGKARTQDGVNLTTTTTNNNNNNPPGIVPKAGPGPGAGPGGATKSWGTTLSGQSASNNSGGSAGSPSTRSDPSKAMLVNENARLSHLDIHGDDAGSQDAANGKKKKRGQRAVGADKNRGLRQFSMKVCEKVESKGRTTYNEVADELVAEFADPISTVASPDQQQYDEKNIRRRVYDALNVLMAMDIISKDKKEIQWKGLPRTTLSDVEDLKAERAALRARVQKKATYLQELEEQYIGLQNLIERNEELYGSGETPTGGVALPFILVQTRPQATVEVEISEDMQLVHFDFNRTGMSFKVDQAFVELISRVYAYPECINTTFELHDDNYVLKAMRFCDRPQSEDGAYDSTPDAGESSSMHPPRISQPLRLDTMGRPPMPPPLPGILKARVKHEQ